MQVTTYLNDTNLVSEKIIFNRQPFRFVASGLYELLSGHGKQFASSVSGLRGVLISRWQVQGPYQRQSGDPLTFGSNIR